METYQLSAQSGVCNCLQTPFDFIRSYVFVLLRQCAGEWESSQSGPATYGHLEKGLGIVLFPAGGEPGPVELDVVVIQNVLDRHQGWQFTHSVARQVPA